jgi:beta-1,4-mannosyl-glycoprotein beta-1,4-N-acetylglucosaminyltransferase
VFDAILFSNEMDMLEIRLRELYDVVDKFVIVESDHTFTGI